MIFVMPVHHCCTAESIQATKPMVGPLDTEDMTNDPATPRGTFTTGPQPSAILACLHKDTLALQKATLY